MSEHTPRQDSAATISLLDASSAQRFTLFSVFVNLSFETNDPVRKRFWDSCARVYVYKPPCNV